MVSDSALASEGKRSFATGSMDTTLLWTVNGRPSLKSGYVQIKAGEVAPLDGEQVLKEMRQLAKQLAQQ